MKTIALAMSLTVMGVGGALGADVVVEGGASPPRAVAASETDDQLELKWDSGTHRWNMAWYTGADTWVGNDFNLSTISTYRAIEKVRFYSRSNWPNIGWDGFRVAIYDFKGAVPGSLLWGPKFVVPTGATGWKEFSVGWTLPSGVDKFVAGQEQFYNYPNCEPFLLDNNPTFLRHSWRYVSGLWRPMSSSVDPYRNLMIRVIVNNATLALTPTSIGRVKALYY